MKNLIINLSLISTLLIGQSALAQDQVTSHVEPSKIETIVVTSKSEVANFEIYSTEITDNAINAAMELVVESLSPSLISDSKELVSATEDFGRSI